MVSLGEHPELRRSLLPPLIIHTAATPMSLPKSSSTGLAEVVGPASRRASSSGSAEPGAPHETKSPVGGACGGPTVGDVQTSEGKRGGMGRPGETAPEPRHRQGPGGVSGLVMQAGTGALALGAKEQSSDSISSVPRVSLEETHFPL